MLSHTDSSIRRAGTRAFVQRRAARSGFTILEILVVLAIIGLIVGLAVSKLGGYYDRAQIQSAQLYVKTTLATPLQAYKLAAGDYPSTADGLQALITPPASKPNLPPGGFIDKLPLDPWQEPYQYQYPGAHNKGFYDLWSKGPDHQSGTEDDIGNWEKGAPENK
jgi:general secretion pathway protein G